MEHIVLELFFPLPRKGIQSSLHSLLILMDLVYYFMLFKAEPRYVGVNLVYFLLKLLPKLTVDLHLRLNKSITELMLPLVPLFWGLPFVGSPFSRFRHTVRIINTESLRNIGCLIAELAHFVKKCVKRSLPLASLW